LLFVPVQLHSGRSREDTRGRYGPSDEALTSVIKSELNTRGDPVLL